MVIGGVLPTPDPTDPTDSLSFLDLIFQSMDLKNYIIFFTLISLTIGLISAGIYFRKNRR